MIDLLDSLRRLFVLHETISSIGYFLRKGEIGEAEEMLADLESDTKLEMSKILDEIETKAKEK